MGIRNRKDFAHLWDMILDLFIHVVVHGYLMSPHLKKNCLNLEVRREHSISSQHHTVVLAGQKEMLSLQENVFDIAARSLEPAPVKWLVNHCSLRKLQSCCSARHEPMF